MQSPARRAILIGMDGASMEVVINMVNGGHMPHLGKLMERGVHRPMIGVFPTLTPPVGQPPPPARGRETTA